MDSLSSRIFLPLALSKDDSLAIKGLAILLMIFHHSFGYMNHFPSEYLQQLDYPDVLVHQLWPYGGVCIALFAFISGYGLFHRARTDAHNPLRTGLRHFLSFYGIYVFLLILFSLLAWWFPSHRLQLPADMGAWVGAFSVLFPPYVDWWYASLFLVLCLICYPLCVVVLKMGRFCPVLILSGFMIGLIFFRYYFYYSVCYRVGCLLGQNNVMDYAFVHHAAKVLEYLPFFYFGFLSAMIFTETRFVMKNRLILFFCLSSLFALANVLSHWDFVCIVAAMILLAPWLPYLVGRYGYRALLLLGRYSVWMWLNHRLFIEYYLSGWLYSLPYWLMLGTTVVLSFLLAVVMDAVFQECSRWYVSLKRRLMERYP